MKQPAFEIVLAAVKVNSAVRQYGYESIEARIAVAALCDLIERFARLRAKSCPNRTEIVSP